MELLFYPGDLVCKSDGICGRIIALNATTALVDWGALHELLPLTALELAETFADRQLRSSLGEPSAD